ncbi:LysM domain-containing protein [Algoriphagus boseongensis]|uniref:LysM domain-containing protein n=1 Tax=Algoriphagus boseongensis TaxID=1442587 RepID=A0A4R6T8H2_9BACT|nr:LysM peptidoglycan-binding domain-containing protein [Algoriphagus boseongensis]TDQ19310.1 LysM domain-containing protein [Algoriphagus boseongensis]
MNNRITSFCSVCCFFLFISLFNGNLAKAEELILGDSIGVEKVGNKTFILHQVTQGETLFSISRRYSASVGEIQSANESLKQGLKTGQTIRIPYVTSAQAPEGGSIHKVSPGETLFSISKKYGVTVDSLKQWNKLMGNDLSVGQTLVVKETAPEPTQTVAAPVTVASVSTVSSTPQEKPKTTPEVKKEEKKPEPKPEPEKPRPTPVKETVQEKPVTKSAPIVPGEWISHTVKQGETLFSISNQYNSSVEDLIKWNALSSNNLRSGQVIKVGRAPEGPSTVPVIGEPKVAASTAEMNVEPTIENTSGGFKNIKENGQAEVIEGTGGHKKYLVLHRSAPVGSIIRVKNEENDMTIFARVVGTLPETGDNSKLVIKLSQAAYDQLRAVNARFPVEVLY